MIQFDPAPNNPSREGAETFIATGTAALIAGLAAAGGSVAAAKIGSNSASHAADVQGAANDKTLEFTKQQAENAYQNSESTRRANYDQWKARQGTIASLGEQYGVHGYKIPDYVPGVDPQFAPGSIGATGQTPQAQNGAGDPQAFIANWQKTHPASEGIGPLAAAYKAAGFGDRFMVNGTTPSNNELVVGGQKFKVLSGENGANPSWYIPGTNDGGAPKAPGTIAAYAPPAAPYIAPPDPYQIFQRGTIGAAGRTR